MKLYIYDKYIIYIYTLYLFYYIYKVFNLYTVSYLKWKYTRTYGVWVLFLCFLVVIGSTCMFLVNFRIVLFFCIVRLVSCVLGTWGKSGHIRIRPLAAKRWCFAEAVARVVRSRCFLIREISRYLQCQCWTIEVSANSFSSWIFSLPGCNSIL